MRQAPSEDRSESSGPRVALEPRVVISLLMPVPLCAFNVPQYAGHKKPRTVQLSPGLGVSRYTIHNAGQAHSAAHREAIDS